MKYLGFIWSERLSTAEELAVMRREIPGYDEEMTRRGVYLFGRELELPATAATVRAPDGETLVSDGPFAETKEFVAGFDLLDCADLEEAVEVTAKSPVTWFKTVELRPFADAGPLSQAAVAFGRGEDGAARPFLLARWTRSGQPVTDEDAAWRRDLQARGLHVLGATLGGADTATTVRVRAGETRLTPGPFPGTGRFIASFDVVSCADRQQAIQLAAAHPAVRDQEIEVRPFYVG